jgi:hypothetical protein
MTTFQHQTGVQATAPAVRHVVQPVRQNSDAIDDEFTDDKDDEREAFSPSPVI